MPPIRRRDIQLDAPRAEKPIEEEVVEQPTTYDVVVHCRNCEDVLHLTLPFGVMVGNTACPRCGCIALRVNTSITFNRESSPPAENGWRNLSRDEVIAARQTGHTNIFGTRRTAGENEFYRQGYGSPATVQPRYTRRDWDRATQEQVPAETPNQFVPPRFSPGATQPNLNQDIFPQEAARSRDNDTPTPFDEESNAMREQLRRDWREYRRRHPGMTVPPEFMAGSSTISAEAAAEFRDQINNAMQRTDTRAFNGERLGVPYTPVGPEASARATLAALGSSLRVPAPVFRGTPARMAQIEAEAAAYRRDLTVPQAALTAAMRDATSQRNADVTPDELRDLM